MDIFPRIKNYKKLSGKFVFDKLCIYGDDIDFAINLLSVSIEQTEIFNAEKSKANVFFEKINSEKLEYYEIKVEESRIYIKFSNELGARNAAASMIALLKIENGQNVIDCCELSDYSDSLHRGFLLDIARKYIAPSELKELFKLLAQLKYNSVHVHLNDTESFSIRLNSLAKIYENPIFRFYEKTEMKELVDFAEGLGLNLIPEIEFPAHGLVIAASYPEYKCRTKTVPPSLWALCLSNDKLYSLIENIVKEVIEIFPSKQIHMGGDELSFYDLTDSGYWPTWDDCEVCSKFKKENNIEDNRQLFYYYVTRVYQILKKYDKHMIMWNDSFDVSKDVNVPKDIIMHFWRIAHPDRGPSEGCTPQKLINQGFKVINSHYEEVYCDDFLNIERICSWYPSSRPFDGEPSNIIGGELCPWGRKPHLQYTIFSAAVLFSDRLWNKQKLNLNDDMFTSAQRALISKEPQQYNVFKVLGGILLPADNNKKYWDSKEKRNAEEVIACLRELTKLYYSKYTNSLQKLMIEKLSVCVTALMDTLIY